MNHDITHCENKECKDKDKCYRYLAYIEIKQKKIDGIFSVFRPKELPKRKEECELFMSLTIK